MESAFTKLGGAEGVSKLVETFYEMLKAIRTESHSLNFITREMASAMLEKRNLNSCQVSWEALDSISSIIDTSM